MADPPSSIGHIERQLGFLEGKVEAMDARMTRREAEDATWREEVKTTLTEINRKVSEGVGGFGLARWAASLMFPFAVTFAAWMLLQLAPVLMKAH